MLIFKLLMKNGVAMTINSSESTGGDVRVIFCKGKYRMTRVISTFEVDYGNMIIDVILERYLKEFLKFIEYEEGEKDGESDD